MLYCPCLLCFSKNIQIYLDHHQYWIKRWNKYLEANLFQLCNFECKRSENWKTQNYELSQKAVDSEWKNRLLDSQTARYLNQEALGQSFLFLHRSSPDRSNVDGEKAAAATAWRDGRNFCSKIGETKFYIKFDWSLIRGSERRLL